MQLKTIEVCVNSDHELESQEEITQQLQGFLSEKSQINVNLDEADFESEISQD